MRLTHRSFLTLPILAALLAGSCASTQASLGWDAATDPLDHLGTHHREVTTRAAEAQTWFDKGLVLTFAFNHDEAIRCYERALGADPHCAMAWWGIAYANGPHINNPIVDDDHAKRAWDALTRARAETAAARPVERDLIEALAKRYAWPNPAERRALDVAYADAMRKVWQAHPRDADVGALFAEAMMDLSPWNQWTKDGAMQPGTGEITAALAKVLELDPRHPLAHHLTIHAWEASQHPERALASADALMDLVPGAGHLVHMPAHTYARVGRWHDSSIANAHGAAVDAAYAARHREQGFYHVYMAHNHHFLAWGCMMEGRSKDSLAAARAMIDGMPAAFVEQQAKFVDFFQVIEMEALMRFGRWEELLRVPEPAPYLPVTRAFRTFTRGVAEAALGRIDAARAEERKLHEQAAAIPKDSPWGLNLTADVLAIAREVLAGEIAIAEGRTEDAVSALTKAVGMEDLLNYNEPYDWMIPVRHALGAVYLRSKRFTDAERVYREDLARFPENGWSLMGLGRALRGQDRGAEAAAVEARFDRAWAHADVRIETSCLCIPRL